AHSLLLCRSLLLLLLLLLTIGVPRRLLGNIKFRKSGQAEDERECERPESKSVSDIHSKTLLNDRLRVSDFIPTCATVPANFALPYWALRGCNFTGGNPNEDLY